jgi:hypothetical protein
MQGDGLSYKVNSIAPRRANADGAGLREMERGSSGRSAGGTGDDGGDTRLRLSGIPDEPPSGRIKRQGGRGRRYGQEKAVVTRGAAVLVRTGVRVFMQTRQRVLHGNECSQNDEQEQAQAKLAPPSSPCEC